MIFCAILYVLCYIIIILLKQLDNSLAELLQSDQLIRPSSSLADTWKKSRALILAIIQLTKVICQYKLNTSINT